MSAFKAGVLFGLRECLYAPLGLLRIRRKLLKKSSSKTCHGSVTESPTQGYYDQALLRRKVSAAMGEKLPAVTHSNPPNNSSCSSKDVLYSLSWIWFINLLVILLMAIFLCIINRLLDTAVGRFIWSFLLIQWPLWALGYTVQASTFLITEIVNSVCLKTICMQTESVKQRSVTGGSTGNHRSFFTNSSSSSKSLGLGAKLMDYSYSIIFFLVYSLQWRLLASMMPYSLVRFILKTCTLSLTYACYAFDFYARQNSDVNVEALLLHISNYWSVFMGYGLPLGFLVTLTSNWYFTGDLLVSFLYPILVIGAFQISWSKALDPKHRVSPCLRDLAVMSMKPALFITNTLISITTSIGLSFIFP